MTSNRNSSKHGEVVVWKMTEEQRLAYIKKYPIVPSEQYVKDWSWQREQAEDLA